MFWIILLIFIIPLAVDSILDSVFEYQKKRKDELMTAPKFELTETKPIIKKGAQMLFNATVNKEEILNLLADGFAEKGEFNNDFTVRNIIPLFKNDQWTFEIEIETDE